MQLSEFVLRSQNFNVAVNAILNQLQTNAKDLTTSSGGVPTGKNLLVTALRTLGTSQNDIQLALQPPPDQCPCVRAFGGKRSFPQEAVSFTRLDGYWILPLYFVYNDRDAQFEDWREAHIDDCLRWLEQPDQSTPTYGMDRMGQADWMFRISPWQCEIDHDTPLKYLRRDITITPDYYVSRVDLEIQINEVYRG